MLLFPSSSPTCPLPSHRLPHILAGHHRRSCPRRASGAHAINPWFLILIRSYFPPCSLPQLLHTSSQSITGAVAPGELQALIGPSGAGKSTLMDKLSMREASGGTSGSGAKRTGVILVNGVKRDQGFLKVSSYVPQVRNSSCRSRPGGEGCWG